MILSDSYLTFEAKILSAAVISFKGSFLSTPPRPPPPPVVKRILPPPLAEANSSLIE